MLLNFFLIRIKKINTIILLLLCFNSFIKFKFKFYNGYFFYKDFFLFFVCYINCLYKNLILLFLFCFLIYCIYVVLL